MWIPRDIEALLRQRAATRPVVVLTGARQTGKTSLVRRLFPEHGFVSLDLPSEAALAEHDPEAFLARHPQPLIVDEAQYAPGLFRHLKAVVDAERGRMGRFLVTGSQRFELMAAVSDSLAGRAEILQLEGLSWSELQAARPGFPLEEALLRGAFPELHADPAIDPSGFFRSYLATYLERDLRLMLQVGSLRDFERFVRACALRTAQLLNKAELARDVGISPSTAAQWLSVLEASGIVFLLEPWYANRTRSLVKTPKLYVCDTGLAAFLVGLRHPAELADSPLAGALWETLVATELRRLQLHRTGGWDLNFWRDRTREVDFVQHRGGRFRLADAKWTAHPDPRDAQNLRHVAALLPAASASHLSLFCRSPHPYPLPPEAQALPLSAAAEWLGC